MKICVIKLGADGDVLRTLPVAKAIKDQYPEGNITWITKGDIAELLKGSLFINQIRVLPYNSEEEFDIVYNFEFDNEAMKIAQNIKAKKKYGFYLDGEYPAAFNPGAEYYLNTLFDDELKKNNKKTYQEMMFMLAEISYRVERCGINLRKEDIAYGNEFIARNNLQGKKIIGIHMGAGARWPSKAWAEERVREFIILAKKNCYDIIIFGGPQEVERHATFASSLLDEGVKVYRNNPKNSKREFASLVNKCSVLVCSDSFALHVAVSLGVKAVGLFFCTSYNEIEGYSLVKKIVSPYLEDFFPTRMNEYSEKLVKSISAEEVFDSVQEILGS